MPHGPSHNPGDIIPPGISGAPLPGAHSIAAADEPEIELTRSSTNTPIQKLDAPRLLTEIRLYIDRTLHLAERLDPDLLAVNVRNSLDSLFSTLCADAVEGLRERAELLRKQCSDNSDPDQLPPQESRSDRVGRLNRDALSHCVTQLEYLWICLTQDNPADRHACLVRNARSARIGQDLENTQDAALIQALLVNAASESVARSMDLAVLIKGLRSQAPVSFSAAISGAIHLAHINETDLLSSQAQARNEARSQIMTILWEDCSDLLLHGSPRRFCQDLVALTKFGMDALPFFHSFFERPNFPDRANVNLKTVGTYIVLNYLNQLKEEDFRRFIDTAEFTWCESKFDPTMLDFAMVLCQSSDEAWQAGALNLLMEAYPTHPRVQGKIGKLERQFCDLPETIRSTLLGSLSTQEIIMLGEEAPPEIMVEVLTELDRRNRKSQDPKILSHFERLEARRRTLPRPVQDYLASRSSAA